MSHDTYENPLITRYASREMAGLWSAQRKHSTWRRCWIALAEAERELGLDISETQLDEMRATVETVNFEDAADYERELRHDVMAHVHAWGDQCPTARPIIHLGATSCFVTDNSDLLVMRDALELVRTRLVGVIDRLASFATQYRDLPCLGFTHLQTAQPTTVGKRATLWCYDFVLDLAEIEHRLETLRLRGVKGTTGTQASFLSLFDGDHGKVERLDQLVCRRLYFKDDLKTDHVRRRTHREHRTEDWVRGRLWRRLEANERDLEPIVRRCRTRAELLLRFGGRREELVATADSVLDDHARALLLKLGYSKPTSSEVGELVPETVEDCEALARCWKTLGEAISVVQDACATANQADRDAESSALRLLAESLQCLATSQRLVGAASADLAGGTRDKTELQIWVDRVIGEFQLTGLPNVSEPTDPLGIDEIADTLEFLRAEVGELSTTIARRSGSLSYAVTGQTYSRKVDAQVLDVLSGIAQSAHKFATDLRLLQHRREVEEPFETKQIGSSAMPYKRNPMRSERICGLARFVSSLAANGANTLATQWMERTLDDSANRRLSLPQSFLGTDAVLILCGNVSDGLVVNERVIARNLHEDLPFLAAEEVLMAGVRAGGDRQDLHEAFRVHSIAASTAMKTEGTPNDLVARLRGDARFANVTIPDEFDARHYIGRAPEQVDAFVRDVVGPIRERYAADLEHDAGEVRV